VSSRLLDNYGPWDVSGRSDLRVVEVGEGLIESGQVIDGHPGVVVGALVPGKVGDHFH